MTVLLTLVSTATLPTLITIYFKGNAIYLLSCILKNYRYIIFQVHSSIVIFFKDTNPLILRKFRQRLTVSSSVSERMSLEATPKAAMITGDYRTTKIRMPNTDRALDSRKYPDFGRAKNAPARTKKKFNFFENVIL